MACQNVEKLCKACQRFQEKKRRNFEWTCQRSLVSLDLPSLAFNKRSLLLDSPELLNMSFIHEMCDYIFLFWRCRIKVYHVKSFSHCVVKTLRSDSNKDWGLFFFFLVCSWNVNLVFFAASWGTLLCLLCELILCITRDYWSLCSPCVSFSTGFLWYKLPNVLERPVVYLNTFHFFRFLPWLWQIQFFIYLIPYCLFNVFD